MEGLPYTQGSLALTLSQEDIVPLFKLGPGRISSDQATNGMVGS